MKLPRDVSGEQLVKALAKLGYRVTRQRGSHCRLETATPRTHAITVPMHTPIKPGTLASILRELETVHLRTRVELIELLFG